MLVNKGMSMYSNKNKKIAGIIAEYNPFHNGHKMQIKKTKELTGSEYVIVVMSGDFVQRGEPAIVNKYNRTRMALLNGADLVIELPAAYALSSAEGFAYGGVSILNKLNCVDYLSFGSESGDIDALSNIAKLLLNPGNEFNQSVLSDIKNGTSYPKALSNALEKSGITQTFSNDSASNRYDLKEIFSPNNILGIEYIKALLLLNSSITPVTIKREDNGYNSQTINEEYEYSSASSLRKILSEGINKPKTSLEKTDEAYKLCQKYIPEEVNRLLNNEKLVSTNDFSNLIYYKLLSTFSVKDSNFTNDFLESFQDINLELCGKINKNLKDFRNVEQFIELLKSKNITYARISRVLYHILFDISESLVKSEPSYARVLGFKKDSTELLNLIKNSSKIDLITKLADAKTTPLLEKDIYISNIYEQIAGTHINEYQQSPIII